MHNIEIYTAFLQYSAPDNQLGGIAMVGILVGLVAGFAAEAAKRSGGGWGALIGAVVFAVAWAVNKPEGPLADTPLQIFIGAIRGAIWCGLWGIAGGALGRRIGNGQQPTSLAAQDAGTPQASAVVGAPCSERRPTARE